MFRKVGIVGTGQLAIEVSLICLSSGINVDLYGATAKARNSVSRMIRARLQKRVKSDASIQKLLDKFSLTNRLDRFSDCDLVLECTDSPGSERIKLITELDSVVRDDCLLAMCNIYLPLAEVTAMLKMPERFIAINFPSQAVPMRLVEIVKTAETSDHVIGLVQNIMKSLSREYIVVKKDVPGYVADRLNYRLLMEGLSMLEEGISVEELDSMARFRLSLPYGICETIDIMGVNNVLNRVLDLIGLGMDFIPSKLLIDVVNANLLGVSSGEGFYKYPSPGEYRRPSVVPNEAMYAINPLRLVSQTINEAVWLLENDVCSFEDLERAMKLVDNWPDGPLELADRYGLNNVVEQLRKRHAESGSPFYSPSRTLEAKVENGETGETAGRGFYEWDTAKVEMGSVSYRLIVDHAILTISRPEKLNALDEQTWKSLKDALEYARKDDMVRVVVITGSGRAFSAGDDIDMMQHWKSMSDSRNWMNKFASPLVDELLNYPKPIISAVNGMAFGGGCELNMLFDIVIASDRAIFSLPEGLIGAIPPIGSSYGFSVNRKIARYALTGEWMSAPDAMAVGIVDLVVPEDQLWIVVSEFVQKILRTAPLSSLSIKSSLNFTKKLFHEHIKYGSDELVRLAGTNDFKEGQRAFIQKRTPKWEGN